jgi:micrococcal nuclease
MMRLRHHVGGVIALGFFAIFARAAAQVPAAFNVVDGVIDGDTISIRGIGPTRLIGINTPESVDKRTPVEYFGREAGAFLRRLMLGKTVRLEYEQQRLDRFKRVLAYVYLADGTFVNAEIVRQGYGQVYTDAPFRYLDQFLKFEREARVANRGLWAANGNPTSAMIHGAAAETMVYVTSTGDTYHRLGCHYLARSRVALSLKQTAGRYKPCRVCRPAVLK